jgi:Ni/Fe-hydrogenase subunit HybB-like protein
MTYTHQPGREEGLSLLTNGPLAVNFWIGELLLGILVPLIILLNNRLRRMPFTRTLAYVLIVGGVIAYRWDVNLVGQLIVQTPIQMKDSLLFTSYTPATIEIIVAVGIVSIGLMLFTLGAKYLRIVDHNSSPAVHHSPAD